MSHWFLSACTGARETQEVLWGQALETAVSSHRHGPAQPMHHSTSRVALQNAELNEFQSKANNIHNIHKPSHFILGDNLYLVCLYWLFSLPFNYFIYPETCLKMACSLILFYFFPAISVGLQVPWIYLLSFSKD